VVLYLTDSYLTRVRLEICNNKETTLSIATVIHVYVVAPNYLNGNQLSREGRGSFLRVSLYGQFNEQ